MGVDAVADGVTHYDTGATLPQVEVAVCVHAALGDVPAHTTEQEEDEDKRSHHLSNNYITSQVERLGHVVADRVTIHLDLVQDVQSEEALYVGVGPLGGLVAPKAEVLRGHTAAQMLAQ